MVLGVGGIGALGKEKLMVRVYTQVLIVDGKREVSHHLHFSSYFCIGERMLTIHHFEDFSVSVSFLSFSCCVCLAAYRVIDQTIQSSFQRRHSASLLR